MNTTIEGLRNSLRKKIGQASVSGDDAEITRCSGLLGRLNEIDTTYQRIKKQLEEIELSLAVPPSDSGVQDVLDILHGRRSPPTTVELHIDWARNGHPYSQETISSSIGADALIKILDRLYKVLGDRVMSVASQLIVSRGPFISRNPEVDYRNASAGEAYQYREWRNGYSVITNTETQQKVDDLNALLRALKLVPGSYVVKKVPRYGTARS
jgi:hypothetical protein